MLQWLIAVLCVAEVKVTSSREPISSRVTDQSASATSSLFTYNPVLPPPQPARRPLSTSASGGAMSLHVPSLSATSVLYWSSLVVLHCSLVTTTCS